jgi:hypothetical protein
MSDTLWLLILVIVNLVEIILRLIKRQQPGGVTTPPERSADKCPLHDGLQGWVENISAKLDGLSRAVARIEGQLRARKETV